MRLVAANAVWGAALLLIVFLLLAWPFGAILAWVFVLSLPTAGIFRLAALIARDQPAALSDAFAWRELVRPAILAGSAIGGLSVVLGFNLVAGLGSLDPMGWAFATLAGWGLLATWLVGLAVWPLMVDPLRDGQPLAERLRLAITLIMVAPARYLGLLLVLALAVLASAIMFAALLTVTIAFVALVLANYVLPLADRIEQRRTIVVTH